MSSTDERLVAGFLSRDESILEEVDKKYGAYCRTIAIHILNNHTEAQDCTTDAFMHAWSHIPPDMPRSLFAYLARLVRNLAIDLYRKKRAEKRSLHMETLLSEIEDCIPTPGGDITEEIALHDALNSFLSTLAPLQRRIFVRRYFYASTISEISKEYGITDSATKTSLHRTRTALKAYLIKKGIQI